MLIGGENHVMSATAFMCGKRGRTIISTLIRKSSSITTRLITRTLKKGLRLRDGILDLPQLVVIVGIRRSTCRKLLPEFGWK